MTLVAKTNTIRDISNYERNGKAMPLRDPDDTCSDTFSSAEVMPNQFDGWRNYDPRIETPQRTLKTITKWQVFRRERLAKWSQCLSSSPTVTMAHCVRKEHNQQTSGQIQPSHTILIESWPDATHKKQEIPSD